MKNCRSVQTFHKYEDEEEEKQIVQINQEKH